MPLPQYQEWLLLEFSAQAQQDFPQLIKSTISRLKARYTQLLKDLAQTQHVQPNPKLSISQRQTQITFSIKAKPKHPLTPPQKLLLASLLFTPTQITFSNITLKATTSRRDGSANPHQSWRVKTMEQLETAIGQLESTIQQDIDWYYSVLKSLRETKTSNPLPE